MMRSEEFLLTLVGADGAAQGTGRSAAPLNGELVAVHVDYLDQPSTTDIVIAQVKPALAILTLTDNNTDGWSYPREEVQTGFFERLPLVGSVSVTVDDGNAGPLVVTLVYDQ